MITVQLLNSIFIPIKTQKFIAQSYIFLTSMPPVGHAPYFTHWKPDLTF